MEEFYKKHGFDIRSNQPTNRRFHIVRYYPKIQTYEFINVGIILYEDNQIYYKLLSSEEVNKLHCPSLVESKVLKNSLDSLEKFLENKKSLNHTLKDISNRYKNILDTSFQLMYAGHENTENLLNKLFYDYIGHKFDIESKKDRLAELIKATFSLVSKDYTDYLEVHSSKIKGYNLDFINKKTKEIHHSLLGSIENSENISRAFIHVPSSLDKRYKYNFLNIKSKLNDSAIDNRLKLNKLGINFYNYRNSDDIDNYCETILELK
ncbi:MAG: Unknown protein [uncultured Sulfurovum sp.]|uniref:Uncharacterized protein n=1 Tax=uncultured Sulfurovum sp. TaxID=269237 RepID=A0A6S6SPN7_9BACT|nr:MAG: Unknown protein [uncultured Sulfurovum sp.]